MLLCPIEIGRRIAMIFHITKVSTYAKQIINNKRSGIVHSVYRNTINIIVNGKLLALQTANSPVSPISLITDLDTDSMNQLSLKAGDTIHFRRKNAIVLDLAPTRAIGHSIRHELYKKFTQIISQSQTNGFELIFQMSPKVDKDFILSAAETKIHEVHRFCTKNNVSKAAEKLCELIGLGTGLTPSGDDFLCGVLAGLHIQGNEYSEFAYCLRNNIRKNLQRTNDISAAFLSSAIEGHFSLAVNELWKNPDTEKISQMFHSIGHSSGMDTLCGIYFLFILTE